MSETPKRRVLIAGIPVGYADKRPELDTGYGCEVSDYEDGRRRVAQCDAILVGPTWDSEYPPERAEAEAKAAGVPVYHSFAELFAALDNPAEVRRDAAPLHKSSARFCELLDELRALHLKKAADYGVDDDPLRNLRASADIGIPAWKGAYMRLKDKIKRLDTYCLKGELANEGVDDTLLDLAAYALLVKVLHEEGR
jgi:hypothetical protein